jgi:hypothetical protein
MKGTTEETLKQIQMSPKDEFGVIHVNILFNPEADRVFCILDAPDKGAVEKIIIIILYCSSSVLLLYCQIVLPKLFNSNVCTQK